MRQFHCIYVFGSVAFVIVLFTCTALCMEVLRQKKEDVVMHFGECELNGFVSHFV